MKFNFFFAICNLIGLGSGVLSDCVDQDDFSWGPFAYSLAVSPVAGMYIFQVLRILKSSDLRPDQSVLM